MVYIVKWLKKFLANDADKRILKLRELMPKLLAHGSIFSNGGGSYLMVEWMVGINQPQKKNIISIHKEIMKVYKQLGEALYPVIYTSGNQIQDSINITEIRRLFAYGIQKLHDEKLENLK